MIDHGSAAPNRNARSAPGRWLVGEADRRMLLIVGIVASIVVAVLGWNGRGGPGTPSTPAGPNILVANPEVRYTTALPSRRPRVWAFGSPGRLAVGSSGADGTDGRVTVFDEVGDELWSETFPNGFAARWMDDDLLITTPGGSGGYQLARRDGATGVERWRVPMAPGEIAVHGDVVYAVLSDRVSMIDSATGAVGTSVDAHPAPDAVASLEADGRFYDIGPSSVQLMSAALEPVGAPIAVAAEPTVGYGDDSTLIAVGGELIRYDEAGDEQQRWPAPVAGIDSLIGLDGSAWLVGHAGRVTMIDLAGTEATTVWEADGEVVGLAPGPNSDDPDADDSDADVDVDRGYVVIRDPANRSALVRGASGQVLVETAAPLHLVANGYYVQAGSRLRAYSLPGRDLLYDSGAATGQSTFVVDGGYVLVTETATGIEIAVLG